MAALAATGDQATAAVAEQAEAARIFQEQQLQNQAASALVQYHQDESSTDAMQVSILLSYWHYTSRADVLIHQVDESAAVEMTEQARPRRARRLGTRYPRLCQMLRLWRPSSR
jgi:hypothetical protein